MIPNYAMNANETQNESSAAKTVWRTLAQIFKSRRVKELEARVFDLERELFESQQFERIAADKLAVWVRRHDDLLIKYKELTTPPSCPPAAA